MADESSLPRQPAISMAMFRSMLDRLNVRKGLTSIADIVGVRHGVASTRDRIVNLLTGEVGTAAERRDALDNDHLRLLIKFGLRRDSRCLDVGANVGTFLKEIVHVAPRGFHIAYEPLPQLCADLRQRFPEVDIRQRALSNREGEAPFLRVLDPALAGYSGFSTPNLSQEAETETIMVSIERLDDHVPEGWLPDLIKIDVEGAELLVIEGSMDVLRKARPTIAFEHGWHLDDVGVSVEIYRLLCVDVGLRLFDMDGNGPLDQPAFLEGLNSRWNWVAHE